MGEPILVMEHISKRFGATVALDDVSLTAYPGEIRGLIGENGSGKSTISSIAAGMQPADGGTMTFLGKPWAPKDMNDALSGGVGMVVQEQGTIGGTSIGENIFLGEAARFKRGPFVNRRALMAEAAQVLAAVGMDDVDPARPMASLDLQDRKLVEIAKVVARSPKVLVIDETTTALSQTGRERLYALMRDQKAAGGCVLFISHDLDELMATCDTLTVLRDGKLIANLAHEDFDDEKIKQLMVGREMTGDYYRSDYDGSCGPEVVLALEHASAAGFSDLSLELHKGEILGIGGLSSCGMHDVGRALFGARPLTSGDVVCRGAKVTGVAQAMKLGLGYVSKDRDVEALNLGASIKDNVAIASLDHMRKPGPFILGSTEKGFVEGVRDELQIKCRSIEQPVSDLSGGNKQKVVFGKWIGAGSDVLILDCPTRGVDIGVKQAMYQLIYKMKQDGASILIISEELAELIGMCDRLLIMKDGQVNGEFERSANLSESDVIGSMV